MNTPTTMSTTTLINDSLIGLTNVMRELMKEYIIHFGHTDLLLMKLREKHTPGELTAITKTEGFFLDSSKIPASIKTSSTLRSFPTAVDDNLPKDLHNLLIWKTDPDDAYLFNSVSIIQLEGKTFYVVYPQTGVWSGHYMADPEWGKISFTSMQLSLSYIRENIKDGYCGDLEGYIDHKKHIQSIEGIRYSSPWLDTLKGIK